MVIWVAEKMNIAASNKLLKLIEEPPNKTIFLLVTENEEQIINTIKSRCQALHFPNIPLSSSLPLPSSVTKGQLTLPPGGIPHGPHPGTIEKSIGKERTEELAVMIDPFKPMMITELAMEIEIPDYYKSWLT